MWNRFERKAEEEGLHLGRDPFKMDDPQEAVYYVKQLHRAQVKRCEEDAAAIIDHLQKAIERGHGRRAKARWEDRRAIAKLLEEYGVAAHLRNYGCDIVQAHFFSMVEMMRRRKEREG
jgi:hypothetical protein